jgi:hypothetical protein
MSAAAEVPEPSAKNRPVRHVIHRPASDVARWHMSTKAVDQSVSEFATWTDLRCVRHLAVIRWGGYKLVTCPHCNTSDEHYWYPKDRRWKCRSCDAKFSVTSKTVFSGRKMRLQTLLAAVHLWACGAAGQPALELRRMLNLRSYNTAFTLQTRLREGLVRGFNTGLISGVIEMDGAHASGRRASERRGRPQTYRVVPTEVAEKEALLTTSARQKKRRAEKLAAIAAGGREDPEYGNVYPASRRIAVTLRRRSGAKGKGSLVTRVGVGLAETPDVIRALAEAFVAIPESILATDTGGAFSAIGKEFRLHLKVNHSETLVGPNGEHCNNSEGFTARQDRSERGVYTNIEPKYLLEYLVETAFHEDFRRVAPGAASAAALFWALSVGESQYWRGFTHGRHRDYEILQPANRPAQASGPKPGRSPNSQLNGRAPR